METAAEHTLNSNQLSLFSFFAETRSNEVTKTDHEYCKQWRSNPNNRQNIVLCVRKLNDIIDCDS